MRIQSKFLSLLIILVISCEAIVFTTVKGVAEDIVGDLIARYGTVVSHYDTEKTLAPIIVELDKAKQLAAHPDIINWSADPDNFILYQKAFNTLEQYRWKFASNSYFIALAKNKGYYHNNSKNEFGDNPLRFFLEPEAENSRWFYQFVKQSNPVHININPNEQLGITRMWIDVQIKANGQVTGALGTGIEFESIMSDLAISDLGGVDTIFVDSGNIIQLYRQSGVTQEEFKQNSFYQKQQISHYLHSEADSLALNRMMAQERRGEKPQAIRITYKGKRHLATVSYIAPLQWYEITLIDMEQILPAEKFVLLYIVLGVTLLLLAVVVTLAIQRWVINPINALESKTSQIAKQPSSEAEVSFSYKPNDEMGMLMSHFELMSKRVQSSAQELEKKVTERTQALERLASVDPLTELFNRRGMERQLREEFNHARREKHGFGLLWLDIDHFKKINDSLGHEQGDKALKLIACSISEVIRDYDSACRWGGDEFLVLTHTKEQAQLYQLAERLRKRVRGIELVSADKSVSFMLSISVGGTIVMPGEKLEVALYRGDKALYRAKSSGRNKTIMLNETEQEYRSKESC